MPRKVRELVDGGIYHIFNRGNNKMNLFMTDLDFRHFLNLIKYSATFYQAKLYHYCLMTNHFHLLLQIEKASDLSKIMHNIQLKYAQYFKMRSDFAGHIFQERFRSPRIPEESYYLQCGRYIERNPVKAGMAIRPEDYSYSSASYYALGKRDDLVTPNVYYTDLGKNQEERQARYRKFVAFDEPYDQMIEKSILLC